MKLKFLPIFFVLITLFCASVHAQKSSKEIGIKQLDSLISSKVNIDKINEVIKTKSTNLKTSGYDPCDADFDNIGILFKNLKSVWASCCNGNSDYAATLRIIRSIYGIINNSKCKWDDRPLMWLAIGLYWADYNSYTSKYDCCK